jgi:two-component system, LytTR family, sensor kinase
MNWDATPGGEPAGLPPIRWIGRPAVYLVAGATVLGLLESLQLVIGSQLMGRPLGVARSMASTMPSWYVYAALVPPTWWVAARFRIERGRVLSALLGLLPYGVLYAVVGITSAYVISDVVFNWWVLGVPLPLPFLQGLVRFLSIYFMVSAVHYFATLGAYYVYEYRRRAELERSAMSALATTAARLEASLARAKLETLRMQLNPHFLFNTLNSISVLAMKGERQRVVTMLARLSELLRMSLDNTQSEVRLADEVRVLGHYIEIEKVRFADRLTVDLDVEATALDALVPSMILQPLVENALRHGVGGKPGPGRVMIDAAIRDGALVIGVHDTGPGFQRVSAQAGTGVGLANTRARLVQLYGDNATLMCATRTGGGATVRIELPARYAEGSATATREYAGVSA